MRIDLVQSLGNLAHTGLAQRTHDVEAEAVDVVLAHPVGNGVGDELADHRPRGSHVGTERVEGRTGVVLAVVVVRHDRIEHRGRAGVVVDHVQNDAHASLVQRLHGTLKFADA